MMKRVVWMATGAVVGAAGAQWAQRKVKRKVAAFTPPAIATSVVGTVKGVTGDLRSVVTEGRDAMRQRESELRAEMEARTRARRGLPADADDRGPTAHRTPAPR